MAVATKDVVIDGQLYHKGDTIWDLGGLVCTGVSGHNIRSYEGLSADVSKLPHYVDTGSSCLFHDTSEYYKFHGPSDTWRKL